MTMNTPEPENADAPTRTGWNPVGTTPVAPNQQATAPAPNQQATAPAPNQPVSPATTPAPVGPHSLFDPAGPTAGDQTPDGTPQGGDDEDVIKPENWHQQ